MYRNGWIAIALAMMIAAPASAQDARTTVAPRGQGYAMVGGLGLDLGPINGALAAEGYGPLDDRMLAVGGGGHVTLGNWILGGEGFFLVPRSTERPTGSRSARLTGGGGLLNAGYTVVRAGRTAVYPMIGIGGGGIELALDGTPPASFGGVVADPAQDANVERYMLLLRPAVGIDHLVPLGELGGRTGGLLVGVRAGYLFTPAATDWYSSDSTLTGGPDQRLDGWFIRVTIGGGSR